MSNIEVNYNSCFQSRWHAMYTRVPIIGISQVEDTNNKRNHNQQKSKQTNKARYFIQSESSLSTQTKKNRE